MTPELQQKMQTIMYALTKEAARMSYVDFKEAWGISEDDYKEIKRVWKEKLGVTPYV